MCGIGGIVYSQTGAVVEEWRSCRMLTALRHRGPDGEGVWTTRDRRVALIHSRLAIVDLGQTGAQPMSSDDGRYHIVFNGEIYNHEELKRELASKGEIFQGTSDTEVLLRLFTLGGEDCLKALDGMFAFAVYDDRDGTVFCARDPLGEKPLYIVSNHNVFAFASEVRALLAAGVVEPKPDWVGVGLFLRNGSIPPPYTHVDGVRMLPAGSFIRVRPGANGHRVTGFWNIRLTPEKESIRSGTEAEREVSAALRLSVRRRLRADVQVGAFLSGGVDSSSVAALMVSEGARNLHTFTVTLPGQAGDESAKARLVAQHLGTQHTEIPLQLGSSADWIHEAIDALDVPSIDGTNTWLVSRAIHQAGMKVACSGLGGDEFFLGYPSFRTVPLLTLALSPTSPLRLMRKVTRRIALSSPPIPRWGRLLDAALAGGGLAASWTAARGLFSAAEVRRLVPPEHRDAALSINAVDDLEATLPPANVSRTRRVSFLEATRYMHDQLLRDSDCMSMAHGLEVRFPLIGLPVVEAVSRVSSRVLWGREKKAILSSIARDLLPAQVFSAPKVPFTLNFRDLFRAALPPGGAPARFLRADATSSVWAAFEKRRTGWSYPWSLVVLERALARLHA
jgi:asparagine synthase (glutamine-hydrolysing)